MATIDGSLVDWLPGQRLDTPESGTEGYALYGSYEDDIFYFAISATSVAIGAGTTIWLDTDIDKSTGFQIFGFTGGAEYNVNFGAGGVARLYTGAAGQTLVANIDYAASADGRAVELAVPSSLLAGDPSHLRVFADVNNIAFLPNSYDLYDFIVGAPPVVVGSVTLDGSLAEWAPATRLDTAESGWAGYALHGDLQADTYLFGISTDGTAIGAGTTIWLDTDLNKATGYQIFGFTGGAEYNVNFGTDGVARLYTGADGQTLVADLDYRISADGRGVEIAVPKALLAGAPDQVRVFADVNNAVFLPNSYDLHNFIVGTPPVVVGSVTLDGSLAEWAPDTRLDTAESGWAGYALHGDLQADTYLFGISTDGTAIGAGTTIWLDTDLNKATGYQIFGFTGGAEYNVNFGTDGVARLYTGAEGQTFVADIDYKLSADGRSVEIAVPKALLAGAPEQVRVFADVNNAVFLPHTYDLFNFVVGNPPPPPPPVVIGTVTVDGSLAEWAPDTRLDTPESGWAGYALHGDLQADTYLFGISTDGTAIGAGTTIWLDTDIDKTTGYQIFGFTGGAEYNVNFGADGVARLYTGAEGQTLVADLDYRISADGRGVEIAVPKALLAGAPEQVRVFADVNNAAFLPHTYDLFNFIVGNPPPPPPPVVIGTVTVDGSLAEWAPDTRLDTPESGWAGYALHGDLQADTYLFGISTDGTAIGAGTTVWLDTDIDKTTGFQIFGFTGGAEYNVNFGTDGVARLYTGGDGQTFVADLDYRLSADGTGAEIAVPKALLAGAPEQVRVFADVNNSVFLPNAYDLYNFIVGAPPPPPPPVVIGTVTLDGSLAEWAADTRLDTPESGVAGYALHGDLQADTFLFGISTDGTAIGAGSTIWLDTDIDKTTGFQIFGFTGGAEYNVNFGTDGVARLYTGADGETFVADLDYRLSANGTGAEIAVPKALLAGAPEQVRVFADVNNSVFLPNSYDLHNFIVGAPPPPPPPPVDGPDLRIGIVFSETTAENYFSATAYSQLFMSAQNQAMQAGIPFDLLSEADLLDTAKLGTYDMLVFPMFSHVQASQVDAITASLQQAVTEHGLGLIAAGNFMTNDETGAVLPGDAYTRMKSLLGVTLEGFGDTDGVTLRAAGSGHPIQAGYGANEVVGQYGSNSYLHFTDMAGSGQVLFSQTVSGGAVHDAVIATETAGRNVHFATDAVIGNNNILGAAIDWVASDTAPDVSLLMTRQASLFYSRNDMDQSQETWDVIDQDPGIYDALMPILDDWHQSYGFVGSYYVNIGANPPDQVTDWTVSKPYYDHLLSFGNEIGSHSYTHPEDTNLLQGDTPALLAAIQKVDPRNPGAVDPWTLSPAEQALLASSFRFQFETSRYVLEDQLGITVGGAAVPGAPEQIDTTREIIRFYDYLSGGFSGVDAGYPGAFGFLTASETGRVYLAPNMSFDFSLIEFQGMTPAQAQAAWLAEYEEITSHATAPIIAFPWHDYGPTNWATGSGFTYTKQMFETLIARAAGDGTEFVTGADLASRIESFAASELTVSRQGNVVTATVQSTDAGHFALDLGAEGQIASVTNWYAWDDGKVFLPRNGGTFEITVGTTVADVTRIEELPARSELISVSGNGSDLDARFHGSGNLDVALRSQGSDAIRITGADGAQLTSSGVRLSFDAIAQHDVALDYLGGGATIAGTGGKDVLIGGTAADILDPGAGADTVFGGGDADTFVFRAGTGQDVVGDFSTGLDILELVGLGFADAQDAFEDFVQTADGLTLSLNANDAIRLAGLDLTEFSVSDIRITEDLIS